MTEGGEPIPPGLREPCGRVNLPGGRALCLPG
jgi:hypothetical protein